MKKNGWGTTEMILISALLLLALIVSIFFISRLYGSFENVNSNKIYMDLETKMEDAARKYIKNNSIQVTSDFRINLDVLQNGNFIDDIKDNKGSLCDGYVIVSRINDNNYYKAYINCGEYKTANY